MAVANCNIIVVVANVAVISGTTKDFPQKFQIINTIRGVDNSAHPSIGVVMVS